MNMEALQLVEQQLVIHVLEIVLVLLGRAHQQGGQRLLLGTGGISGDKQPEVM